MSLKYDNLNTTAILDKSNTAKYTDKRELYTDFKLCQVILLLFRVLA